MALKFNVPGINGDESAKALVDTITTTDPDAKVDVDVEAKTVTVESAASEETIKQVIVASGYTLA